MKIRVRDPKEAAAITGGCTFEPAIGWWTYTDQPEEHGRLGRLFEGERDALYIPTLQKNGQPVAEEAIARFKVRAKELGFGEISGASGMWILSDTGEAQVEYIWICWASQVSDETRSQMAALAEEIKAATNQDCVAWENGGQLFFTG